MPFLIFRRDHLRSNLGIISGLGIICGRGSFAALYITRTFPPGAARPFVFTTFDGLDGKTFDFAISDSKIS